MREKVREVSRFGSQVAVLSWVGNSVGEAGFSRKSISLQGLFPAPVEVWKDGHVFAVG